MKVAKEPFALLKKRKYGRRRAKPKTLLKQAAAESYRRIDRDRENASERIRQVLRLIRTDLFRQDLTVARVRRKLRLRSHDATTWFRRQTGATIRRYIEDRRLEIAQRLVLDSQCWHQASRLWKSPVPALAETVPTVKKPVASAGCGQSRSGNSR